MNKIMLITGASGGIGLATARLAARQGYALALHYHGNEATAQDLLNEVRALGTVAIAVRADITREDDVVAMFERIMQEMGPLAVLVNNAGITGSIGPFVSLDASRIRQVFDVNVLGSFLCAREAVKHMAKDHGGTGGSIVNISSAASRFGSPGEYIDYAASKGAIDTFTLGLAREMANQGIRVNAIRPGLIDTEIHEKSGDAQRAHRLQKQVPMQRIGKAEEVAEAILWLAGDSASFVTGALLDVSGGR